MKRLATMVFVSILLFGCSHGSRSVLSAGAIHDKTIPAGATRPNPHWVTQWQVPTQNSAPAFLAMDGSGNVWFSESSGNKIGELDPQAGTFKEYVVSSSYMAPEGIAFANDGSIWFAELESVNGVNYIGRLDPLTGKIHQFGLPVNTADPLCISKALDGQMWFTYDGGIALISSRGVVKKMSVGNLSPYCVVTGAFGRAWFTDLTNSVVGWVNAKDQYRSFSSSIGAPFFITLAPNDALYYDVERSNYIGRVRRTGVITAFQTLPIDSSQLIVGIAADSLGNVWYAVSGGNTDPNTVDVLEPGGQLAGVELPAQTGTQFVLPAPNRKIYYSGNSSNSIGLVEY